MHDTVYEQESTRNHRAVGIGSKTTELRTQMTRRSEEIEEPVQKRVIDDDGARAIRLQQCPFCKEPVGRLPVHLEHCEETP